MRIETILGCALIFAVEMTADAPKTVWSGVYSPAQASRGESVYRDACGRCHRLDLSGYTGLRGDKFVENWRADSLESLWVRISKTMPAGAPASLSESEYLDVLAFILRENGFPEGREDLKSKEVPAIRFESKAGAESVPDFALVQTTGCLAKAADGSWKIGHASELTRTRNPDASSETELKAAASGPLGDHVFLLLDGSSLRTVLRAGAQEGRKVRVKGYLIRKQNDDRINPTSVEALNSRCF